MIFSESVSALPDREGRRHLSPAVFAVGHAQCSAAFHAEEAADVESEAEVPVGIPIASVEGTDRLLQRLLREAGAVIAECEEQHILRHPELRVHLLHRKAHRIGCQILADTQDQGTVGQDHRVVIRRYQGKCLAFADDRAHVPDLGAEDRQTDGLRFGLDVLELLYGVHLLGIAPEACDLLRHLCEDLGLLVRCELFTAALHQLDIAPEHRQRRAQVVGKGRGQALALLHRLPDLEVACIELPAHLLKGRTQSAQFVIAAVIDGEGQIVFRDLLRGFGELLDRHAQLPAVEQIARRRHTDHDPQRDQQIIHIPQHQADRPAAAVDPLDPAAPEDQARDLMGGVVELRDVLRQPCDELHPEQHDEEADRQIFHQRPFQGAGAVFYFIHL